MSVLSVCNVRAGLLWPNGGMDQDATWYGGRPRPWSHCVRWGPSSHSPKGHSPAIFGPCPMSIVVKRSPISATAEHLCSIIYNVQPVDMYSTLNMIPVCKALRYMVSANEGSQGFICRSTRLSHAWNDQLYPRLDFPATQHHRTLAGAHF